MDIRAVQTSYARWAPVYDKTFGAITDTGRRRAVDYINTRVGNVLEVGIGTGLSLPQYRPHLDVTGIDFSADMLAKARRRVRRERLDHVGQLRRMDARSLDFPDDHFDTVAAMHVLSVVPEPERVVSEIARVVRPGGQVVIVNHFARTKGFLSVIERLAAPFADHIGWHSDFEIETVLREGSLAVEVCNPLPPLGIMTILVLSKPAVD